MIYPFRHRGWNRGAHLSNWYKTLEHVNRATNAADKLSDSLWQYAYAVEKLDHVPRDSELPKQIERFADDLDRFCRDFEDLRSRDYDYSSKKEKAEAALLNAKTEDAQKLVNRPEVGDGTGCRIKGHRYRALAHSGVVHLIWKRSAKGPYWVGFKLILGQRRGEQPVLLKSNAAADRFLEDKEV